MHASFEEFKADRRKVLQHWKQTEGPQRYVNDSDYERGVGVPTVFSKTQSGKIGPALGDLNFQRAFCSENKQWFWDSRPSI